MLSRLRQMFGAMPTASGGRRRLTADQWPAVVYAIGDVHGCLDLLRNLERKIVADASRLAGEKWLVMLGDYVDRGSQSAGVLDHLMQAPPDGFSRTCLAGNHEIMLLSFLDTPRNNSPWLQFGGLETLASYGITAFEFLKLSRSQRQAVLGAHIPDTHVAFMRELPAVLSLPGTVFVHAGLRPSVPLEQQSEDDLLWIREPFLEASPALHDIRVVHGHTPMVQPELTPNRIGIDTGAFATGVLTAVRLQPGKVPVIIQTGMNPLP